MPNKDMKLVSVTVNATAPCWTVPLAAWLIAAEAAVKHGWNAADGSAAELARRLRLVLKKERLGGELRRAVGNLVEKLKAGGTLFFDYFNESDVPRMHPWEVEMPQSRRPARTKG